MVKESYLHFLENWGIFRLKNSTVRIDSRIVSRASFRRSSREWTGARNHQNGFHQHSKIWFSKEASFCFVLRNSRQERFIISQKNKLGRVYNQSGYKPPASIVTENGFQGRCLPQSIFEITETFKHGQVLLTLYCPGSTKQSNMFKILQQTLQDL